MMLTVGQIIIKILLTTSWPVMVFLLLFCATPLALEVAYRTNTLAAYIDKNNDNYEQFITNYSTT